MHGQAVLAIVAMVGRRIAQLRAQQWHQLLLLDHFCRPTTPALR
jgi:hypothetical protein